MSSKIRIYDATAKDDPDNEWLNASVDIEVPENNEACRLTFDGYGENEEVAKKELILEIRRARTALSDWLDANTPEGI